MKIKLSVCGCECSECEYLKKAECSGCSEIQGKVWWADHIHADICPIYACVVNEKKLETCGNCPEIPCRLWRDLKDPNHTDEQHEASIKARIANIKKLKEKF